MPLPVAGLVQGQGHTKVGATSQPQLLPALAVSQPQMLPLPAVSQSPVLKTPAASAGTTVATGMRAVATTGMNMVPSAPPMLPVLAGGHSTTVTSSAASADNTVATGTHGMATTGMSMVPSNLQIMPGTAPPMMQMMQYQYMQQYMQMMQYQQQMQLMGSAGTMGTVQQPTLLKVPTYTPVPKTPSEPVEPKVASGGAIHTLGWPAPSSGTSGMRINALCAIDGNVRNDVTIPKSMVGRLIGTGGAIFKELTAKTACNIFILDREGPPPGASEDERVVVLVGNDSQVGHATYEIDELLRAAKKPGMMGGGPGSYMYDARNRAGPTMGDGFRETRDGFQIGRTYGTHDWSGVGAGPRPFLDLTTVNEDNLAPQIGPQAGPPSGTKRNREEGREL